MARAVYTIMRRIRTRSKVTNRFQSAVVEPSGVKVRPARSLRPIGTRADRVMSGGRTNRTQMRIRKNTRAAECAFYGPWKRKKKPGKNDDTTCTLHTAVLCVAPGSRGGECVVSRVHGKNRYSCRHGQLEQGPVGAPAKLLLLLLWLFANGRRCASGSHDGRPRRARVCPSAANAGCKSPFRDRSYLVLV